ncbi:hypothetical protein DB30_02161 [Enhygromyxa salina]|uniref:Uncharacterized protein n=1 Tax=Enhygromyxa salina TaxID=215803 RepID=A0A0C2D407_9BACT|nr:hypothetical protein [Enhygromyxa salina]KIG17946.1 hypothetical protein DB30_02161 [Enhygromyxa salina]
MSIVVQYTNTLDQQRAAALRAVVAANPSTTAAQLKALVVEFPALGGVVLRDVLPEQTGAAKPAKQRKSARKVGRPAKATTAGPPAKATTAGRPAKATKPAAVEPVATPAAPAKAAGRSRAWNVRTDEGRAELDAAVLEGLAALGGKDVRAEGLRKRLGATPHQLRTALNRHIGSGAVTYTGQARGTRYSLV